MSYLLRILSLWLLSCGLTYGGPSGGISGPPDTLAPYSSEYASGIPLVVENGPYAGRYSVVVPPAVYSEGSSYWTNNVPFYLGPMCIGWTGSGWGFWVPGYGAEDTMPDGVTGSSITHAWIVDADWSNWAGTNSAVVYTNELAALNGIANDVRLGVILSAALLGGLTCLGWLILWLRIF